LTYRFWHFVVPFLPLSLKGKAPGLPSGFDTLGLPPVGYGCTICIGMGVPPLEVRLDTPAEVDSYTSGGILPYVLDQILA